LKALTYVAPMVGYTHQWSEKFRSTATFGYVNLQNEGRRIPPLPRNLLWQRELVWQLRKRLSVGLECLYGYKDEKSGAHGDVWRVQTESFTHCFDGGTMPQPRNNANHPENISRFLRLDQSSVSFSPLHWRNEAWAIAPRLDDSETMVNQDREDDIRKMLEAT